MKQIFIKNKIKTYEKNNWHSDIVDAYYNYIKNKDESSKKIVTDHFKGKEVIWESIFNKYLKKINESL